MPCMPPHLRSFALCLVVASFVAAGPASAAPGDLDPTFDGDGIVVDGSAVAASGVLIQTDGNILAVLGGGFGVARYDGTGSVDLGFGSAGHATADFGGAGQVSTAGVIAPGGTVVVSGFVLPGPMTSELGIARFDTNGALDPSFGSGGKTETDVPGATNELTMTMVRLPSGRLVTGGDADLAGGPRGLLVAYDATGTVDAGFGMGGIVLSSEPSAISALAVAADAIVAAGSASDGRVAVARFGFDGTAGPITTFLDVGSFASALAIDSAGRIVVAGGTNDCNDTFVARILPDGTLDPDFGTDGIAIIDVVTAATAACGDFARALAMQPDGRILVASEGQTYDAPPSPLTLSTWWLLRLDPDGAVDVGFGNDGFVSMDAAAAPRAMALQGDGKVVTGGFRETAVYDPPFAIYLETSLALTRNEAMATPVCAAAARNDCGAAGMGKSALQLSRRSGKKPALHWTWKKGTTTSADFGDPITGGSYALCLYDGSSTLVGTAQVEGGGLCRGKPCWKTAGRSGWQYKNPRGTVFGVDKLKIQTGSGNGALDLRGKHANLPVVPLPATLPLRVQLQTSAGSCFEAIYSTAKKNDATDFSAKN